MEFQEFWKQKYRMCNCLPNACVDCGLDESNTGTDLVCRDYITAYPREAEKIVQKWAAEHPVVTNADKFREVFGFDLDLRSDACAIVACNGECEHCDKEDYYTHWVTREYIPLSDCHRTDN